MSLCEDPETLLSFPQAHRVGDFLVRAATSGARSTSTGNGDGLHLGASDPFALIAAPVICAGWRWAKRLRPELYWNGCWPECPAERWARLELAAGSAVNHAAMLHAMRCSTPRWSGAQEVALQRAWQHADRMQARAMALWLWPGTQVVVGLIGVALVLAVYDEGERRLSWYVEG